MNWKECQRLAFCCVSVSAGKVSLVRLSGRCVALALHLDRLVFYDRLFLPVPWLLNAGRRLGLTWGVSGKAVLLFGV